MTLTKCDRLPFRLPPPAQTDSSSFQGSFPANTWRETEGLVGFGGDRWDALTPEQKRKFPPLCPDFVIELRSETDSLQTLQAKMREYIENGARLGWLIDPKNQRVEIYRPGQPVEVLQKPATLSGEAVLPGFVLDLKPIFSSI